MTDGTIELTRRKILASTGAIGLAGAGAGMGTSAFFSDEESFDNNSLTAGELDLRIDWQQVYRNGAAGSPGSEFVNAHPDQGLPDGTGADDGIQSLDSDEYDSVPDDGLVEYTDDGTNIQEYLTCETLRNHDDDSFGDQDHLVELSDVKPGDSGEITFSFHLCDNPGCIWLQGGNLEEAENGHTEPEAEVDSDGTDLGEESGAEDPAVSGNGELLENIRVRAWYDIDCDNAYDEGESKIFAWGTLDGLINDQLSGTGRQLNPLQYGIAGVNPSVETSQSDLCLRLGKLEFEGEDQDQIIIADDSDGTVLTEDSSSGDPSGDSVTAEDERYKLKDTDNDEWAVIDIIGYERKDDGEVIGFYFEVDEVSSDGIGICQVDVKGGGGADGSDEATNSYTFEGQCVQGITQNREALYAPVNPGGQQSGVSNAVFYYCTADKKVPTETMPCFPGEETFCVGFEWFLPTSVGNEIQSDSVSFDLGFYAEQSRHNDDPGQTMN